MRRLVAPLLPIGCLAVLAAGCYGGVLFGNRQFGYRDAAHYYYPLYERVQREWDSGRWPLWEPGENAGVPLLGDPTAAVLYPGKVVYALLPYAWGARAYVVAHAVLAFAAMLALMRSWGTSWTGSSIGALSYAFGAPILFLYSNVIFLVGAAWVPLGFRAIDRWLRRGRRLGVLELAVVLALQVLGGDPESAYVTGVCAAGYAVVLTRDRGPSPRRRGRRWRLAGLVGALAATWVLATLALAWVLPVSGLARPPWPGSSWTSLAVMATWSIAGLILLVRALGQRPRPAWLPRLAGLAGAAMLAAMLSAAQLLPVLEFLGLSDRAEGRGPHDVYAFSLEPVRVVELIWPNLFGTFFPIHASWLPMVPSVRFLGRIWTPSLYVGGLTIVLALASLGFRGGPPWRAWLSAIAIVSLAAGLGECTSPIWWARWQPALAATLGPHDPEDSSAPRADGKPRDGDGGVYWLLMTVLPGFNRFRYPAKLFSFTAMALAALAGLGWDRVLAGERQAATLAGVLLGLSVAAAIVVTAGSGRLLAALQSSPQALAASPFGPPDVAGAVGETRRSVLHGTFVSVAVLALLLRGYRRPALAGAVALLVLTADLGLANARLVHTVPQELMERVPAVVEQIERAERGDDAPTRAPFRVHRLPVWSPLGWFKSSSPDRIAEVVAWERDTIHPKYGLGYGIEYTSTQGAAELSDYLQFFKTTSRPLDDATAGRWNARPGQEVIAYPRRAFDLWNTRYFVLTPFPKAWLKENPGIHAYLDDTDLVFPRADPTARHGDWLDGEAFQILRNRNCWPRAWLVHEAREVRRVGVMGPSEREQAVGEVLLGNDHPGSVTGPVGPDLRHVAWLERDEARALRPFLAGGVTSRAESVRITSYEPQHVALEAVLDRPGLVILSDVYYPGWRLTIDGAEAPVYRANLMMRGAALPAGRHRLVYRYDPGSFRLGGRITLVGLTTLAVLGLVFARDPVSRGLADSLVRGEG